MSADPARVVQRAGAETVRLMAQLKRQANALYGGGHYPVTNTQRVNWTGSEWTVNGVVTDEDKVSSLIRRALAMEYNEPFTRMFHGLMDLFVMEEDRAAPGQFTRRGNGVTVTMWFDPERSTVGGRVTGAYRESFGYDVDRYNGKVQLCASPGGEATEPLLRAKALLSRIFLFDNLS